MPYMPENFHTQMQQCSLGTTSMDLVGSVYQRFQCASEPLECFIDEIQF
jgi:hypothetical protein